MTLRAVMVWGTGLGLSVLAHLGVAVALALSVEPEPVAQEPAAFGAVELASQSVPVESPAAEAPEAETPAETATRRPAETPGTVPTAHARPIRPEPEKAGAAPARAEGVSAAPLEAEALARQSPVPDAAPAALPEAVRAPAVTAAEPLAAARPVAERRPVRTAPAARLSPTGPAAPAMAAVALPAEAVTPGGPSGPPLMASDPNLQPLAAAPVAADPVAGQTPEGPAAAAVSAPADSLAARPAAPVHAPQAEAVADPLSLAIAEAARVAPGPALTLRPATLPVGGVAPPAPPLASLAAAAAPAVPVTEHATAALAWAGDGGAAFDPVSFAAVQSFLAPKSDVPAGTVRDGIGDLLARVPCARMQAVFVPETGALEVRGHLSDESQRAPLAEALAARLGGSIPVEDRLVHLPAPQCLVISGLAGIGLPQSGGQSDNPFEVGTAAQIGVKLFRAGEQVRFVLETASFPSWLQVDYFDAQGNVLHLIPNRAVPPALSAPRSRVTVGEGLALEVAPPFGRDIVVAYATSEPVAKEPRPEVEPAGPWIAYLRDRIATLRQKPGFRGEWVYLVIETGP